LPYDKHIEEALMGSTAIIDILIQEIEAAERKGVSRYELARRTGVPQSTLSRLIRRERASLKVETVEKLCRELGLELVIRSVKKGTRK